MAEFDLTETLDDGRPRYTRLGNGAIYDHSKGRIVGAPTKGLITSENARAMLARRHELARERAIAGIDEAAIEAGRIPQTAGSGEGWQAVVKHVAKTLMESKNLRGQAEAANFLGKASGHTLTEGEETGIAERLGTILERYLSPDIIEGEVKDVRS